MTKDKALRLALEALENHCGNYKLDDAGCERWNKAVAAIKEALAPTSTLCEAQPEQEPSITKTGCGVLTLHSGFDDLPDGTKFYTTPQASVNEAPKRPWVGLTEDEIIAVDMHTLRVRGDGYTYARAIEAKLKEKNNGN